MGFLTERCTLRVLTRDLLFSCKPFVCGNEDLDEYFSKDAALYQEQLLGKTYCYTFDEEPTTIVCAFTLSNDSVRVDHLPSSRRNRVNSLSPFPKRLRRYPAVLIGRLGVNVDFADMGVGSRRDVKSILKAGRVKVNSVIVTEAEAKIDIDADNVELDGKRIGYEEYRYYMLNKPAGVISATKDKLSDTVIEIIKGENTKDLFPVGRLDKDSEGLLIISNDGKFAHNVLSPAKHVDKTYFVRLDKKPNEEEISRIENGIDIGDDKPCLPAKVEVISDDEAYITISEGRFHQVKRMFQAVGINVTYLKRISMGALKLDENLAPGEYKKLSKEEINEVFGG